MSDTTEMLQAFRERLCATLCVFSSSDYDDQRVNSVLSEFDSVADAARARIAELEAQLAEHKAFSDSLNENWALQKLILKACGVPDDGEPRLYDDFAELAEAHVAKVASIEDRVFAELTDGHIQDIDDPTVTPREFVIGALGFMQAFFAGLLGDTDTREEVLTEGWESRWRDVRWSMGFKGGQSHAASVREHAPPTSPHPLPANCPLCGDPADGDMVGGSERIRCYRCFTQYDGRALYPSVTCIEKLAACIWIEDDDGNWFTGCNEAHSFENGGPEENKHKFCPYCGKTLRAVEFESEAYDDDDE